MVACRIRDGSGFVRTRRWEALLAAVLCVACDEGGASPRDTQIWLGGLPEAPTGESPIALVTGDFDGDGKLDVATVNQVANSVSVLLGLGNGTFRAAVDYPCGGYPVAIVSGDFNRDGKPDLATASWDEGSVSVFLNRGQGTFAHPPDVAVGPYLSAMVAADFDKDGTMDLAVASQAPGTVSV